MAEPILVLARAGTVDLSCHPCQMPAKRIDQPMPDTIKDEVSRRRTFAIIAHPDAGKTTLTEKLLLFGGAIQLAGKVKAKKDRISARSD